MSDYNPLTRRVGEPSPQTDPDLFDDDDIRKEIRYLLATNKRYGSHPLRTSAYLRLQAVLDARHPA
jgi:hypothetical protein